VHLGGAALPSVREISVLVSEQAKFYYASPDTILKAVFTANILMATDKT